MTNSRLKDYFDLSVLIGRKQLDVDVMAKAIRATFDRRLMAVPITLPIGLSDDFSHDPSRQALRQGFLKKNELALELLAPVVDRLRATLHPAMQMAATLPRVF